MSSVLQRTSRHHHRKEADGENIVCPQRAAPAFPLLVALNPASEVIEDAPSRGVPLLIKGKQFNLSQRGLKETSGFWYISRLPKRQESRTERYDTILQEWNSCVPAVHEVLWDTRRGLDHDGFVGGKD